MGLRTVVIPQNCLHAQLLGNVADAVLYRLELNFSNRDRDAYVDVAIRWATCTQLEPQRSSGTCAPPALDSDAEHVLDDELAVVCATL